MGGRVHAVHQRAFFDLGGSPTGWAQDLTDHLFDPEFNVGSEAFVAGTRTF